jgi:cytochrome d ubiquinol oxidase subunit I
VEDGRAVFTNVWAAIFTSSLAPRFVHTVNATFMTGAFVSAGIAAHYLLKRRHIEFAKRALVTGIIVGTLTSVAQPFIGHWHALEVAADQPIKMAAMEAIYDTQSHAPLSIIGWVDEEGQQPVSIAVPSGLSLILGLSPDKVIQGLNTVPPEDRPNVELIFQSWHLMIGIGVLLALVMVIGLLLMWRRRLHYSLPYLKTLRLIMPLPFIATFLGWITTEAGRQPWIVQGQLRTADAVSPTVSTGEVATTLAILMVIYTGILIAWLYVMRGIVRKGPSPIAVGREEAESSEELTHQPEAEGAGRPAPGEVQRRAP